MKTWLSFSTVKRFPQSGNDSQNRIVASSAFIPMNVTSFANLSNASATAGECRSMT